MMIRVVDVGGTNLKLLATSHQAPGTRHQAKREFLSAPGMTTDEMVIQVKRLTSHWRYHDVTIGYPGPVREGHPAAEPGRPARSMHVRPKKTPNSALCEQSNPQMIRERLMDALQRSGFSGA